MLIIVPLFGKKILNISSVKKDIDYLVDDGYLKYKFEVSNKDIFKNIPDVQQSVSLIINAIHQLPKDKQYILYGYGAIGNLIAPHIPNLIGLLINQSY